MTIAASQLFAEMKLGVSTESLPSDLKKTLENLISYSEARVEKFSPNAPTAIKERAIVLLSGYLYEFPNGRVGKNSFMNSGARDILQAFRDHTGGTI